MKRLRTFTIGGAVVLALSGATAAAVGFDPRGSSRPANGTLPPATAEVTRATLTETADVDGTLGYGAATPVESPAAGRITWLPAAGSTVERGQALYKVDERPVVLLLGAIPMYRTLAPGTEGADVKQFEQNLAALGYTGFTVDETYSASTASAVRRWQERLGLSETGTVTPDAVVYAPAAIRVAERKANVGGSAGGPVLTYTGTARLVSVDLNVAQRTLVTVGARVKVTLPDRSTVDGVVAGIGTVAQTVTSSDGKTQTTTVEVTVTVADQARLGSYDEAPVDVTLVANQHKDVLTVPIVALLALPGGGYGVQVVDGSTTRTVTVRTGMFAGGRVEVSGEGIAAGTVVGVPA